MRVLVYDRTCVRRGGGLSIPWAAGAVLYRAARRLEAARGVASWDEALAWLATLAAPIDELQYWGHGTWGAARVGDERLDARSLLRGHPHRQALDRVGFGPAPLVWFRTCQTVGARAGIAFAESLADLVGGRVAGHTHVIGFHQSGLHGVAAGRRADWSPDDGLRDGTPDAPRTARPSRPWAPRTITCLHGRVPDDWFA
ncbi:MAG TPA: hypothetical protein VHE35_03485 [Kofleriaceae bacterium]|nr:hypothetical protein [Kofleriaceae bacterium]